MPLRLVEFIAPAELDAALADLPHAEEILGRWEDRLQNDMVLIRMLVQAEQTEEMLDYLQTHFSQVDGFRVMLLPVEATLPRPPEVAKETKKKVKSPERVSREELYNDVANGTKVSRVFVAQTVLATLVATVGLLRNDTAVLIGAMVIAPLLGPNVALCLATALGDANLAMKALKANMVGLAAALLTTLLIGAVFVLPADSEAIELRTHVSGGDIILALAAGCAGVLAFTTGAPTALIGVMVAVALLPPFAAFGLLLAAGEYRAAAGALLLVATNVICVNLSGVVTFVVRGLRPRSWWEAERARKATRLAVVVWSCLLLVLLALIYVAQLTQ